MNAKDIAVESKITFSRNVKGYPFPSKLRDTRANVIASGVYEALAKNGGYELYKIAQMSEPVTRTPRPFRTSARGAMDTPPIPTRWARRPGLM